MLVVCRNYTNQSRGTISGISRLKAIKVIGYERFRAADELVTEHQPKAISLISFAMVGISDFQLGIPWKSEG